MDIQKVLRQEKKYLLAAEQGARLAAKLEKVIQEDPHNGENGYMVRSLYFDTLNNKDYEEKMAGTEVRRKVRLRVYDPEDDFALIEIKQKQGGNQLKRSMKISREHAQKLSEGDYSPLTQYKDPFAGEVYGILNMSAYIPRTIIEYRRKAFIMPENSIRITFDSQINATESNRDLFSQNLLFYPVQNPWKVILEVKYNGFLLSYVKNILQATDKSEIAVSKYCMGRAVSYRNLQMV
ncbi:polyphosphate polymerase domain-containing protein [Murimonas intestini]|uniref:VTC domain-containing protein n=1 Tax=Murimonas intestini TaxID=1337051 RepID=A0AB73TA58_9FIRM|nr:polyphosphate polymerase domain-containing protein [Murimonas intestini]MCR1839199.1 polyphosphate polymerase domain-containing protein [Murimonas intestini]MCR1864495.1 polyphosphate polymerase domain-containing protein [Murimonas intestini]MCR1882105.1 polyphosphate polymerase domain-containing protein [Murimonas intestini]